MVRLVFTSRYHVGVNDCMVDDFIKSGNIVILPDNSFASHISFFDSNEQYRGKGGVRMVSFDDFLRLPPIAIVIPCIQMVEDFYKLMRLRGDIDQVIYLTANSNSLDHFPVNGTDYVLSQDLYFHRTTNAKYKAFYFNRPLVLREPRTFEEIKSGFESKQINLYIHNFDHDAEGFDIERPVVKEFDELWQEAGNNPVAYYGHGNRHGKLSQNETHHAMAKSMFSLISKRRETFGQSVNESMLLGTPCIFFRKFLYSTFTEHEINNDNAIIVDSPKEAVEKIQRMRFEDYETLCKAARYAAERQCADDPRIETLQWFFGKVFATSPKFQNE